jgi:hypothetical protein
MVDAVAWTGVVVVVGALDCALVVGAGVAEAASVTVTADDRAGWCATAW